MRAHLATIDSLYMRLPRRPESSMSAAEHVKRYAVRQKVQDLVKGKRRNAGAELVELLHRGPEREAVMEALTTGVTNSKYADGTGIVISFAGLCYARRRFDVLQAVVDAGIPQWVLDIPRMDADPSERPEFLEELRVIQFSMLRFPLPKSDSPSDWMRLLTGFPTSSGDASDQWQTSLFRIATEPASKATPDFLDLAFRVDPDHPDIEHLAIKQPEAIASMREMQMRRQLLTSSCAPAAPESEPSPQRRARRVGL